MSEKKRRFGVAEDVSAQLGQMISIGTDTERLFRDVVIPCERIEPDPDNPRKLAITQDELFNDATTLSDTQNADLDKLKELATSITSSGLINPITVVKNGDKYRIIAGERRFLATLLAGKNHIDARVFETKPGSYELKLIQWYENNEREDLSILDRLDNIRAIIHAYQVKTGIKKITAQLLGEIIGLSKAMARHYLNLLEAPADVTNAICTGKIKNVEVAALVCSMNAADRAEALAKVEQGESISSIKQLIAKNRDAVVKNSHIGRVEGYSLGKISDIKIVKTLVNAIIDLPEYKHYANDFQSLKWDEPAISLKAFKRLISILEKN